MTKSESKYFNTAQRMDNALLALMERKGFEYITVKEICQRAGVSRSTFYLHYETVGDLLNECVEQMNRQFLAYFDEAAAEFRQNIRTAPLERLFLITPEYLTPYLTYVSEHRDVFRVVFKNPQALQTDRTYAALLSDILNEILARHAVPEADREYVLTFYINGIMGIVRRWLLSDCAESVEHIASVIMTVIRR